MALKPFTHLPFWISCLLLVLTLINYEYSIILGVLFKSKMFADTQYAKDCGLCEDMFACDRVYNCMCAYEGHVGIHASPNIRPCSFFKDHVLFFFYRWIIEFTIETCNKIIVSIFLTMKAIIDDTHSSYSFLSIVFKLSTKGHAKMYVALMFNWICLQVCSCPLSLYPKF